MSYTRFHKAKVGVPTVWVTLSPRNTEDLGSILGMGRFKMTISYHWVLNKNGRLSSTKNMDKWSSLLTSHFGGVLVTIACSLLM